MSRSSRSSIETQKGPADWFTGDVNIDAVAAPEATSMFAAASVHSIVHIATQQNDEAGSPVTWGEQYSGGRIA